MTSSFGWRGGHAEPGVAICKDELSGCCASAGAGATRLLLLRTDATQLSLCTVRDGSAACQPHWPPPICVSGL